MIPQFLESSKSDAYLKVSVTLSTGVFITTRITLPSHALPLTLCSRVTNGAQTESEDTCQKIPHLLISGKTFQQSLSGKEIPSFDLNK